MPNRFAIGTNSSTTCHAGIPPLARISARLSTGTQAFQVAIPRRAKTFASMNDVHTYTAAAMINGITIASTATGP
jgi:hypothetical protein